MTNIEAITPSSWAELGKALDNAFTDYMAAPDGEALELASNRYWDLIELITNKRADTLEGHRVQARAVRRVWADRLEEEEGSAYGRLFKSLLDYLDPIEEPNAA
jgi:hypothetical protein